MEYGRLKSKIEAFEGVAMRSSRDRYSHRIFGLIK